MNNKRFIVGFLLVTLLWFVTPSTRTVDTDDAHAARSLLRHIKGDSPKKKHQKKQSVHTVETQPLKSTKNGARPKNKKKGGRRRKQSTESTRQPTADTSTVTDTHQGAHPFAGLDQPVIPQRLKEALEAEEKQEERIRWNFKETGLKNILDQVSDLYHVTFLPDDAVKPMLSGRKGVEGHKVTFNTHRALTYKEAWDIFLSFLDMAGLTLVPGLQPDVYLVTAIAVANKSPIPAFIGTPPEQLPDNDTIVRFIYFVQNSPIDTLINVINAIISSNAVVRRFDQLNALFITDKASNIRGLMKIVSELDNGIPEAMSILKLKRADAVTVAKLYENIVKIEEPQGVARLMGARKQPTSLYFPADARIIPEPRTNTLIILGPERAIKKIEDFIVNNVDVDLKAPETPLHVYELQYANAQTIAQILQQVTTFAPNSSAAQYGSIRDGQKYFKQPVSIIPEQSGNRLIIRAEYSDYKIIEHTIKKLDVKQPQVAIEVLIVDVSVDDQKGLGGQLRNKTDGSLVKNANFQTSGFFSAGSAAQPVVNSDTGSILGNLITLATSSFNQAGSTLLTIGNSATGGIWGIFKILNSYSKTNIISNPFLTATNKYQASSSLGSTRYVKAGTVQGAGQAETFKQVPAKLTVNITPQINSDGIIQMQISITIDDFVNQTDAASADKTSKQITTAANIGNNEVLALGGLVKTKETQTMTKTDLLGDIPIVGWLFKNKYKQHEKQSLLIFISPHIIEEKELSRTYSEKKAKTARKLLKEKDNLMSSKRDPVQRWFFKDHVREMEEALESNLIDEKHYLPTQADSDAKRNTPSLARYLKPTDNNAGGSQ